MPEQRKNIVLMQWENTVPAQRNAGRKCIAFAQTYRHNIVIFENIKARMRCERENKFYTKEETLWNV